MSSPKPRMIVTGNIVDVVHRRIYHGSVHVSGGRISRLRPESGCPKSPFILPGFVDSHVHVESSMLSPGEFCRAALIHGVVGAVSDPHEIANVSGLDGVRAMLAAAKNAPFHFAFGAPSCVPATHLETSGAAIGPKELEELFDLDGLTYLSEVMNVPGVLNKDPNVIAKLAAARSRGLPIDGHAPGLRKEALLRYIAAGPATDHESLCLDEAREKAANNMKILIRHGSAASVLNAFMPLLCEQPQACMFCSDDRHPDDLLQSHINAMVQESVRQGVDLMDALRAASLNPARHYKLAMGLLQEGDSADFIVTDDLRDFKARQTWVRGQMVAMDGKCLLPPIPMQETNRFEAKPRAEADFAARAEPGRLNVIKAIDGEVTTEHLLMEPCLRNGFAAQDVEIDLLKLSVVNRYAPAAQPAIGFVNGFGLKRGALASSIAHDSHNIVAVGVSDKALARAVNLVVGCRGALALCSEHEELVLPLPIAGLMSNQPSAETATLYGELTKAAHRLGCALRSPFMTLSFMALPVIPKIKLTDRGLFDSANFRFLPLFEKS